MGSIFDWPLLIFVVVFGAQAGASYLGNGLRKKVRPLEADLREDFNTIQTATLTLLGLIIGFSFSMAVSRYDQRKNCEEVEANAIGTEFFRADLLPAGNREHLRDLLKQYAAQRVAFYEAGRLQSRIDEIDAETAKLQSELWSTVLPAARAQPTAVAALVVAGMNNVIDSQGFTVAAWQNRIPVAAWGLMGLIAIACNLLLGFGSHRGEVRMLLILPVIVSIAFFLIADIDSPRGGVIRVLPHNLIVLNQSIGAP